MKKARGCGRSDWTILPDAGLDEAKGSGSFLKKRTKKLLALGSELPLACPTPSAWRTPTAIGNPLDKSFLLLFFKKEALSLPYPVHA
jgi:hypothetical protein